MSFSVRVEKTLYGSIKIGVTDSFLKMEPIDWKTLDVIYYDGANGIVAGEGKGWFWGGGNRLKTGELVTMTVDLKEGEVTWAIDKNIKYRHSMPNLRDYRIKWVPYLWMQDRGDCV